MFIDAGSSGLAPLGGLGDYHLQSCWPAINSGDNTNAPTEDIKALFAHMPAWSTKGFMKLRVRAVQVRLR